MLVSVNAFLTSVIDFMSRADWHIVPPSYQTPLHHKERVNSTKRKLHVTNVINCKYTASTVDLYLLTRYCGTNEFL
jgi:hypothetical protein